MSVNVNFELATACYLLYCASVYYRQRHLQVLRNRAFFWFMTMVVVTTYLDIISTILCHTNQNLVIENLSETLYLVSHVVTLFLFFVYICMIVGVNKEFTKNKWMYFIPAVLAGGMALLSPITNLVFKNESTGYHYGMGLHVFTFLSLFYVLFPVGYAIKCRNKVTKTNLRWIFSLECIVFFGISIQMLIPHGMRVVYIFNGLVVFLCLIFIQNADYFYDEVTGLFQIQGFEEVVKEKMIRKQKFSILLIRICNYESLGGIYGDTRLIDIQKQIADVMTKQFPKEIFYHVSASSFAVFTESAEKTENIYATLDKELPRVWLVQNEKIVHEYVYYHINCPEECADIQELMRRLYYARSDHRGHHKAGSYISLSHETVRHAQVEQEIVSLLEKTLMDNSIELAYQPIYSIEKDRITSLEVLARLKDKDKNYINPEKFIHIAEENRLILRLGELIYRKACQFAKENHLFSLGIEYMNINLSPLQCSFDGLTEDLTNIAGEYGIPMSRIHLEITESAIMNRKEIQTTLHKLNRAGAMVALDDFGTGYASLTSILNLPIDYVKIDKSLVWSYSKGENQFLNQLIPMIQSEGKKIIAEGVETKQQVEIFKQLKGDFIQGYYYSRPLPGDEFVRYVKKANGHTD